MAKAKKTKSSELSPALRKRIRFTLISAGVWILVNITGAAVFILMKPTADRWRAQRLINEEENEYLKETASNSDLNAQEQMPLCDQLTEQQQPQSIMTRLAAYFKS